MILLRFGGAKRGAKETANRPQCSCTKQRSRLFSVAGTSPATTPEKWFNVIGKAPRNKQHERHGGTAAPVFLLYHHRSKRRRLPIGLRRRRHITELGGRRRSGLRRGRTSRSRLLGARLLTPVPSVEQPESPESGERPGYPRPDVRDAARPFGTTPLIVAARIGVAWVRHDSTPFLVDQRC
jgi:hypothetical protein